MQTVQIADLPWHDTDRGDCQFRRKRLGRATDGDAIGCSLYEVPPDTRAWPYHYHTANEEALYVLDGVGTLRSPTDDAHRLAAGVYASFPTGPDGAHAIENTGSSPLRYLTVSTMRDPEVLVYPDAETVGVMAGAPPGGDSAERSIEHYFQREAAVGYWTMDR